MTRIQGRIPPGIAIAAVGKAAYAMSDAFAASAEFCSRDAIDGRAAGFDAVPLPMGVFVGGGVCRVCREDRPSVLGRHNKSHEHGTRLRKPDADVATGWFEWAAAHAGRRNRSAGPPAEAGLRLSATRMAAGPRP